MKILVTGGAGFIGGNFVHYMVNKYPEDMIINLDLLTYAGNLETLKPVEDKENYKFVKGDIADRKFVFELFEKERPDVVINFAAESHVDRSITDPESFVRTNVIGTTTLMDAAKEFGVKRYHQVSTDEVYGDLPLDRLDLFFTEQTPLHTSSPYSSSKAAADLFVLAYHRTYGLPVTISRCSNNYGPYHFPEKLIPLIISRALANEELPVYGKGENVRDWLHVKDHCSAIDLIVRNGKVGEVYNVGGHNERTNLEVVKTILKALDKPESLIRFVTDRPGHDMRYAIDPTKLETELGWKPEYNFDTGIVQTIDWYLNNREWWEHIVSGEYTKYFVIMAAGIGSRFGGGIKQLEPVGSNGEIIMDYSIYDAIKAGFDKIVFIIRKDIEEDFKNIIGRRIEAKGIEVEYAYQELENIPEKYKGKWQRTKPWGTAHAILSAKDKIKEPFMVINADDYYGREAFIKLHDYLANTMDNNAKELDMCMAGFKLVNTLSDNGGVTRGVCEVKDGLLSDIKETYDVKLESGIISAKDFYGNKRDVSIDSYVSLNMWGLPPSFVDLLDDDFEKFLSDLDTDDIKTEYILPAVIDELVKSQKGKVRVLETDDKWFGVTYKEDKPMVVNAIKELIEKGMYE